MANFFIFISDQWMLVSVLMVLIYLFAMNERKRGGELINHHKLVQLVNAQDAVVVDLREKKERKSGYIVDSVHLPYTALDRKMTELEAEKAKPIVLVDKMGQFTGAAGTKLKKEGFNIYRLDGGMLEWKNSNLPVIKG